MDHRLGVFSRELRCYYTNITSMLATCLLLFLSFRIKVRNQKGEARMEDPAAFDPSARNKGGRIYVRAFIETPDTDAADHCPMKTLKRKREYNRKTFGRYRPIACDSPRKYRLADHSKNESNYRTGVKVKGGRRKNGILTVNGFYYYVSLILLCLDFTMSQKYCQFSS